MRVEPAMDCMLLSTNSSSTDSARPTLLLSFTPRSSYVNIFTRFKVWVAIVHRCRVKSRVLLTILFPAFHINPVNHPYSFTIKYPVYQHWVSVTVPLNHTDIWSTVCVKYGIILGISREACLAQEAAHSKCGLQSLCMYIQCTHMRRPDSI